MKFSMNIKKLRDTAKIPTYGSEFSAGADLYACLDEAITVAPSETRLVPTGLALEIPEGLVGLIYARSGLASKKGPQASATIRTPLPLSKLRLMSSPFRQ